ncbi:hypothetical protein JKF63_03913 [Porcisia hertigi]|uniref:Protein kinase domain-containing protein n=1 Tax=Porcisia hertigi TaxID=2761500 RepID=A0A836L468_9TRYP|nr:hypothetical protein JKF63_03907 [Porcisia hertigi]KAG5497644.1 hypothetical protein JKF63_03909 [Porcisia hertigi]KAG5497648.1 hypothetical protein JKF63_03913 [Porcisia hertigi]
MRECERCVRLGITSPLSRTCASPLGVDEVLGEENLEGVLKRSRSRIAQETPREEGENIAAGRQRRRTRLSAPNSKAPSRYPEALYRCVVHLQENHETLRYVLPSAPRWIRDHMGYFWHLPHNTSDGEATPVWKGMRMAIGSTGYIASASFSAFRDVHPVVAKAIREAPPGPMSDALRSATPVCGPSPAQEAFMDASLVKHQSLRHPNIMSLIGYSHSLEGGVVLIWEFSPGGTLRDLRNRYLRLPAMTANRFGLQLLSALSLLHEHNIAHGNISLDTIMAHSDGHCRLAGLYTDEHNPFVFHRGYYVSPAIAAGAPPTPPCDVFCYGLVAIEALTEHPCWRWATQKDGQPFGAIEESLELIQNGGQAFYDAVVQGRLVANADVFDTPAFAEKYSGLARKTLRSCLLHTPSERPTAVEVRNIVKILLSEGGLACEEDED